MALTHFCSLLLSKASHLAKLDAIWPGIHLSTGKWATKISNNTIGHVYSAYFCYYMIKHISTTSLFLPVLSLSDQLPRLSGTATFIDLLSEGMGNAIYLLCNFLTALYAGNFERSSLLVETASRITLQVVTEFQQWFTLVKSTSKKKCNFSKLGYA